MEFQPGDVVKLKSGGEKMTVESINDGLVDCVWMVDKKLERNSFEPIVIKKYQPSAASFGARSF